VREWLKSKAGFPSKTSLKAQGLDYSVSSKRSG
jgi:hypothetical protein